MIKMGWKGERYRHGLSARGIKTVVPHNKLISRLLPQHFEISEPGAQVKIEFITLQTNPDMMKKLGIEEGPRTEFIATYQDDGQWVASYPEANETFIASTLEAVLQDIKELMLSDQTVASIGDVKVEYLDEKEK